jgi:hypothetical protein
MLKKDWSGNYFTPPVSFLKQAELANQARQSFSAVIINRYRGSAPDKIKTISFSTVRDAHQRRLGAFHLLW